MYGMLLQSVAHFIQLEYGEEIWLKIAKAAKCKHIDFNTHHVYSDSIIANLATAGAFLMKSSHDEFMEFFGRCFVRYLTKLGYDITMRATGRFFTDFLQNIDNLHSQFCFTYPKMKSPSFQLNAIDWKGVTLVYRSGRHGFNHYVIGQLRQIATDFFQIDVNIRITERASSNTGSKSFVVITYRLDFDNSHYMSHKIKNTMSTVNKELPSFPSYLLLQFFPFAIIIDSEMRIFGVGEKLIDSCRDRENTHFLRERFDKFFKIRRPKGVAPNWKILRNLNFIMFELEFNRGVFDSNSSDATANGPSTSSAVPAISNLLLKGQIKFIEDINALVFLCSPVINDLDELPTQGLFLNDLNQHGLSKELVMAGWQHNSKFEIMFDAAEKKSNDLEDTYSLLNTWKKRGDDLLYSMIPKPVADRLREGASNMDTCEIFDVVSILFCELQGLEVNIFEENVRQGALEMVTQMNTIFSKFDDLLDKFHVYKVETVGQVYMVTSGAPERTVDHAENIARLALEMVNIAKQLNIEIRIGIHSGPTAGGVVGIKVPRYCFFGDTINTASRMMSTSQADKINISHNLKLLLPPGMFLTIARGEVDVKGKGAMQVYWLVEAL